MKLKYPNFEVVIYDNTPDGGVNAGYLNELAEELGVVFEFKALHARIPGKTPVLHERLAISHNWCRLYALDNGYKHMLHLETDVIPEPDVIERLLAHKKYVVGALYYRDMGRSRKLMVQRHVYRAPNNIITHNLAPGEDVCFIDGTLKKVAHVGLGCVLIDTRVFQNILFRYKKGVDSAPDTYFAEDCFHTGVTIFADTSLICEHRNEAWGNFGVDYE